jgi:hypothetical protein
VTAGDFVMVVGMVAAAAIAVEAFIWGSVFNLVEYRIEHLVRIGRIFVWIAVEIAAVVVLGAGR